MVKMLVKIIRIKGEKLMTKPHRKITAEETVRIQTQGRYTINGKQINFADKQKSSLENSRLFTPEDGKLIVAETKFPEKKSLPKYTVINQSAVQSIIDLNNAGQKCAVLNFASAKSPGGGFLNGSIAQEEALAISSGLYNTLLRHNVYYDKNRECQTAMYTDYAIYSPDVVFFRDSDFKLLPDFATASVLTLPAVNMGQVILKGENREQAKRVMKNRMRLCLALFAKCKESNLILGAYGCGVFKNDPKEIALWWKELLEEEGYGSFFESVVFAVLARDGDISYSVFADVFC